MVAEGARQYNAKILTYHEVKTLIREGDRITGAICHDLVKDEEVLISADMVDLAGRMIRNEKGEEIFNFGKHKGKKVLTVLQQEPAYYDWMMNGDFPQDTKRKLTEIKLRGFRK